MKHKNVICIQAQDPELSDVQQAFQPIMGPKPAAQVARAFLLDRIATSLQMPRCDVCLAFWPPQSEGVFNDLLSLFQNEESDERIIEKSRGIPLIPQVGETPGERMAGLSRHFFDEGARRLLIIRSESPLIEPLILRAGLELLARHQVVVGPTFAGDYYLIGTDGYYPLIFDGIDWKANDVYKQTQQRLGAQGFRWQELELSYEISGPAELQQLCCDIDNLRLAGKENICRHTEKCLVNLKI